MRRLFLAYLLIWAIVTSASAQAPPGTGGYTFQGQGNIAQVFSGLVNPQYGQVPFGTKLGGYSLLVPGGDIAPAVSLGQFNVTGAHWTPQTCSTSPCNITGTVVSCNASSGPIVLQLPGAGGTGFFATIQKVDQTNNACIVTPAGSDTINTLSQIPITTPFLPMLLDDSQQGSWLAGLLTLATGSTGGTGFPLLGNGDFNNFSGINIGGLQLVRQPAPSNLTSTTTCSGTCATTYTYEVTCLTQFGESATLPNGTANTTTAINAASLSTANHNELDWTLQPQCRSGYNVYGRIGGSLGLLITLPQTTVTWTDDGSVINPANTYGFTFASAAYPAVEIWDLQGAVTSGLPVDISVTTSINSTRLTLPSITTTQNHDLQVGVFAFDKSVATFTGPSGFTSTITVPANAVSNYGLAMPQKDRATAGATGTAFGTSNLINYQAGINLAIKSSNTSNPITLGNTPTFTTTSPYSSISFGDPSGTNTGDLELICVAFQAGTSIQPTGGAANFQPIASVISNANKVQLNCYTYAPTVGGLPPPPLNNTTGSILQTDVNGTINNISLQESYLGNKGAYGNSTNFPTGNLVAQTTANKAGHFANLTITTLSLNAGSCTTAPTFNIFDGSTATGTAKQASNTVQNTKGTATTQAEALTFQPGDIIGIYVSTQGGTCTAPDFAVYGTLVYP